jgi:membrane associated rhomboid family serine protease
VSADPRTTRLVWLTPSIVALAALLMFLPALADLLRLEPDKVRAGEIWRSLSGHLVHDQVGLAVVDLSVLAVLGTWWEFRSRALCAWILLASALAGSMAIVAFSSFSSYIGSSALSSGLFVGALVELLHSARRKQRNLAVVGIALFVGKCTLESTGYELLSSAPLEAGTQVAAAAHWAGGVAGALVVVASNALERRRRARA